MQELDGSKRFVDLQRRGFWKNVWNGIKTVWNENKDAIIDSVIDIVKNKGKKEDQPPTGTTDDVQDNDKGDDQDDDESEKELLQFLQLVNSQ